MTILLTCNDTCNPIGVDKEHVRIGFAEIEKTCCQSYEFRISSSEQNIKNNIFDVGVFKEECIGNHSVNIPPYLLKQCSRYYWQVTGFENNSDSISGVTTKNSHIAFFETGLSDWTGQWICGWTDESENNQGYVQNFIKEFYIEGEVEKARLYITGLGFFDGKLNGHQLDEMKYKPLVTDYAPRVHPENPTLYTSSGHRVTYYTYDVSELIKNGDNVLDVDVADGYFYNTEKVEYAYNFSFGSPRLIYELHILVNGQWQIIKSDIDTLVCRRNYKSTLYRGDCIDFTKSDTKYTNSVVIKSDMGKLVSSTCQEDKICDVFEPLYEKSIDGGNLYDFGVNHTGGLDFIVEAKEKTIINICYAEVLDSEGKPNYDTSIFDERSPQDGREPGSHQQTTYIVDKGITEIKPLFSWKCYRYAWIKIDGNAKVNDLKSLFIHMNMDRNGHFESSDDTLNRINEVFVQTVYCNLHSGLLMDCPHREKRPYTGDGNQVMKSVFYNMDAIPFFYKWLDDMEDAQTTEGKITNTVPNFGGGGGYAWGNAICTLTKELYHYTGDMSVVKKGYEIVKKWLDYYESNRDDDYGIRSNGAEWLLGDWLATDTVVSNVHYINTCCYYIAVDTAEQLSEIVNDGRSKEWNDLKQKIAHCINNVFYDKEKVMYGNGVQGEDVLALSLGIVPKEYETSLKNKVENHYTKEMDYHFDTGIVLTPVLINYLTENGYRDIAFGMMTAKTYPSYYTLMENETTFSEHWSKKWPDFYVGEIGKSRLIKGGADLSHCHPMYGSVVAWLYEKVAGMNLGKLFEKRIEFTPYFTDYLTSAKAGKNTAYGQVSIDWKNTDEGLIIKTTLPDNLTGHCRFPSKYKMIKCLSSDQIFEINEDGYFDLEIPSGNIEFVTI